MGINGPVKADAINKYNTPKNSKIVDHDYKFQDNFMIINNAAYRYEMPYNKPYFITQSCNNGTVTLQCVAIKVRHNILHIKSYTSVINVEDITTENMYDNVNILSPVI